MTVNRAMLAAAAALAVLLPPAHASAQEASASPSPSAATPSPSPTNTPHSDVSCPFVEVDALAPSYAVGEEVVIRARLSPQGGTAPADFALSRLSPGPAATVRTAPNATDAVWTVRLGESHRLQVTVSREGRCLGGRTTAEVVANIRPALSITARRNAVRDYTFAGRVLPGRGQQVNLYRVEADGRRVLTSRTVVARDGTYSVRRLFTGSGRFGFEVQVGESSTNLAGSSPVRPTVIH